MWLMSESMRQNLDLKKLPRRHQRNEVLKKNEGKARGYNPEEGN